MVSYCPNGLKEEAPSQMLRLLHKQFMVGVVDVCHDPGHSAPAPPSVNVLKAGQCISSDALSSSDHSVKGFQVLRAAVAVPGSHASRDDRLGSGREEGFLQPFNFLRSLR